ncbi:MAG: hypothetical protein KAR19_03800 [Bacteroidales bacterium]|nr:hypothetical protein [Bacteroidales bacterium]
MSKLKAILALLTGNIVKDIGDAFDKNFTSKDEKNKTLIELEQKYNERLKIITEMTEDPDSWLSKNVRPLCLLIALGTLSVIMLFDIQVNDYLLKLYAGWTGSMITLYFGAREIVKLVKRKRNS